MDPLDAISPIDGRYRSKTEGLDRYFSERALIDHRMEVEVRYLIALSEHPQTDLREFSHLEKLELERLAEHGDAESVKAIEAKTNHDVKAVEYYIRDKLKGMTRGKKVSMDNLRNFVSKLEIPDDVKERLKEITPQNYNGLAKTLCDL